MSVQVSIIICTRDRAASLRQTLGAICALQPAVSTELLVVDNASRDDTAQVVADFRPSHIPLRYLFEGRAGKGNAYNAGMAAAGGEVLLFTDDDVRPPPRWIDEMSAPILGGEADAVAGGVVLAPHLHRPWMTPCHRSWLAGTEDLDPKNPGRMVGANMAFSRRVLEKVPRFDTELGPGALSFFDETLFSRQLVVAGYRIAARLEVAIEHHPETARLSRANFLAAAKGFGRSLGYVEYHWEHREKRCAWGSVLDALLRLGYWRIRCLPGRGKGGGIPEREMQAVMRVHTCWQFVREQQRPRNYTKHGLVKLTPETV